MFTKKDQITYCLALSCMQLMDDGVVEYSGMELEIKNKFMVRVWATMRYYKNYIDDKTKQYYLKIARYIDMEIKRNEQYEPLLFCNELMAAWLQDNSKHLKFWSKYDFSEIYDHIDDMPEGLDNAMYEKAQNVIFRITGKKYNREKASRLLKLKAIKLRLQHEAN